MFTMQTVSVSREAQIQTPSFACIRSIYSRYTTSTEESRLTAVLQLLDGSALCVNGLLQVTGSLWVSFLYKINYKRCRFNEVKHIIMHAHKFKDSSQLLGSVRSVVSYIKMRLPASPKNICRPLRNYDRMNKHGLNMARDISA